jgi:hypothetical protein
VKFNIFPTRGIRYHSPSCFNTHSFNLPTSLVHSAGYNDGLHASGEDNGGVSVRLTPEFAANYDFEPAEQVKVDEATFNDQLGMAATELLESDVARLVADADRLEPIFLNQAGGQE